MRYPSFSFWILIIAMVVSLLVWHAGLGCGKNGGIFKGLTGFKLDKRRYLPFWSDKLSPFKVREHFNKRIFFIKVLVRERSKLVPVIESNPGWTHTLCKLSLSCVELLASSPDSIAASLRFLQIYTNNATFPNKPDLVTNIYKYLVSRKYFSLVRTVIDSRVPPVLSETTRPPTPLAGEILQMVLTPVNLAVQSTVTYNKNKRLNHH